jgi:hypothetical protein
MAMILMNVRQAQALVEDVKDMKPNTWFELHQVDGRGEGPPLRTVELRIPDTEHQESGDYLFPDGSTGY